MKKTASMNKREVLDVLNKLARLQQELLNKLAQNSEWITKQDCDYYSEKLQKVKFKEINVNKVLENKETILEKLNTLQGMFRNIKSFLSQDYAKSISLDNTDGNKFKNLSDSKNVEGIKNYFLHYTETVNQLFMFLSDDASARNMAKVMNDSGFRNILQQNLSYYFYAVYQEN